MATNMAATCSNKHNFVTIGPRNMNKTTFPTKSGMRNPIMMIFKEFEYSKWLPRWPPHDKCWYMLKKHNFVTIRSRNMNKTIFPTKSGMRNPKVMISKGF